MADRALSYSHKEVRLNLESAVPNSTVVIRLPSHGASAWSSRAAQKRPVPTDVPPAEDENTFRQRHIASAAAIFYRQHHRSPRGFLWRILEDGKVLSIQVADLCKQDNASDPHLTLRLMLPSSIRPLCIAFADGGRHDVLNVFVLTESNHLYTLTLRPEFFRRRSGADENVGDWCKIYNSSAFGFKHPHRLVSLGSEQLLLSLHDGSLLRLDRVAGEDGSLWKETFYNEGGWTHGLKSLMPFQSSNAVRYGKINMELSAVISIASSSTIIDGVQFVFTVSLDHRIRIWNLATGKVAYSGDLLEQERLPNEMTKYVIHPSQSQLIKTYRDSEGKLVIVTFSPIGAGRFKFWTVATAEEGNLELEDLFPDEVLEPPTPTSDVWTLADFSMAFDRRKESSVTLWALWKNNTTYRVHNLDFIIDSPASMRNSWAANWTTVAGEVLVDTTVPTVSSSDSADITEKWLDFILFPARFTTATVETALSIYERGLGGSKHASIQSSLNLAKRMCLLIASATSMDRNSEGEMEYEKFRTSTNTQWLRFYRLLIELDKQRGEALSFAFDTEHHMAWVVTADGLSAVRDCSATEQVFHNLGHTHSRHTKSIAQLISGALTLRDSFSDSILQSCDAELKAELFSHPRTDSGSVAPLWDRCNLAGQITDDDYEAIKAEFGGSFDGVGLDTYRVLLNMMTAAEEMDQRLERLPLTALGCKTIVRGVQETVELHRSICVNQLVLLMFFDKEADAQDVDLETLPIYKELFIMLKRLELLSWLFKSQISKPVLRLEKSGPTKRPEEIKTVVTVLEGCVGHLLGIVSDSGEPTSSLVTDILIRVCDPDGEYELQPALIQCFLLTLDRPDLALEFSRFCDQDPFSTYIQGRAFLAAKDLSTAAVCFKKAAFGLAHPDPKMAADRHSSGLLDDTEWNLLYAGLHRYYYHIVSLFDKERFHSFVVDFARIALQFAVAGSKDHDILDLRNELLSRLFNAALQTYRYDTAYSALALFTNHALQLSSLRALVFKMCETSSASELMDLPFLGLQSAVDDILAQRCHSILDVNSSVPYHKILYAWRIKRNDFRGAATVSLERLQRLQHSGDRDKTRGSHLGTDGLETPITKQHLILINALSCVDPKQAWILAEPLTKKSGLGESGSSVLGKRKVVTLDDARRGYQEELDRIAAIENNQFTFEGGDEMELA